MGHFLNMTQKNIPLRMWRIYPLSLKPWSLLFGLQLTKQQRNSKSISWQTLDLQTLKKMIDMSVKFYHKSQWILKKRKAFHRRLYYCSTDGFYSAFIYSMVWSSRCKIASSHWKDCIYEPWSHVCGCAIPSSCAPVPPSRSLCSFAVMSTNPEIYVPAGKHGLLFIVPL